jgi:hypothetical protein
MHAGVLGGADAVDGRAVPEHAEAGGPLDVAC